MKWTNQRKLSVGVLALAAGAFAVDQLVLRGGQEAGAGTAATASVTPRPAVAANDRGPAKPVVAAEAEAAQPMAVLARHLQQVAAREMLVPGACKDGFRPPAAWYPEPVVPAAAVAAKAGPTSPASRAPAFQAAYRVTAVLRTGPRADQGMAVLHGKAAGQQGVTVRVGQEVGGFVLKAVHDRGVTFADGREQVELLLPEPGLATGGDPQ